MKSNDEFGTGVCTGDNTKKIWVHWFLAKARAIAAEDLGGAVTLAGGVQGDSLLKAWVRNP